MTTTTNSHLPAAAHDVGGSDPEQLRRVRKEIRKHHFATVATGSPAGRPHVAGIQYATVGDTIWFNTMRDSRKGRNIAANPHVAVCIPVRKLPAGPPYTIQYQATATLIDADDPEVTDLVAAGELKFITGHGELTEPGAAFVRVTPLGRVHSYGIGVKALEMIRDPLHAGARCVELG